jgi:hypothetical protein
MFGDKLSESLALAIRISILYGDVLAFYIAQLAQSQPNCLGADGLRLSWKPFSLIAVLTRPWPLR